MRMSPILPAIILLAAACTAEEAPPPANDAVEADADGEIALVPPPPVDEEPAPSPSDPAAAVIPAAFQGEWNAEPSACGSATESRLRIEPDRVRFHESLGTVRDVKVESDRAIEVTADYEGEGERWTSRRRFALSADGGIVTMSGDGTSVMRTRCP